MKRVAAMIFGMFLAACTQSPPPSSGAPQTAPPTSTQTTADPQTAKPRFVDRVWRVDSSSAVAPGTTYAFLADGTLVINAPSSTAAYGHWTYTNAALVMIEEGIAYPTDILALDEHSFAIRSHNPGEPVDIKLVAADEVPLPKPAEKPRE